MNFNTHYDLRDKHAFLSASNSHWVNYPPEKLEAVYRRSKDKYRGTQLHNLAETCIQLGVKLPRTEKTLDMYVNDAIGYRMSPEVVLFYSHNAFGTADAISFQGNLLRIHDLKTGVGKADMRQLYVYVALFCLEYGIDPKSIKIEVRKYQLDQVFIEKPEAEDIAELMAKIVDFDRRINEINLVEE